MEKVFVRFVCDNTVGKLARLLRMAGFDTAYVVDNDVGRVIALCREEDRKIVSRNSRYAELVLADNFYHVKVDNPEEQFCQVVIDLKLTLSTNHFLSRCLNCNRELEEINKADIKEHVFPYVFKTQERFSTCPNCNRIFWQATHARAIKEKLLKLKSAVDRRRQAAAD